MGSCETDVGWGRLLPDGILVAGRPFSLGLVFVFVLAVDVERCEGKGIELFPLVVFG